MMVSAEWVTAAGTAMAGFAALIAGWAAIRGVDAWRSELVGRRKAELAEDVLAQFYRARDVLIWARLPYRPLDLAPEVDDPDQRHRSHASPIERLTQESTLFSELQASRYRFMAYFGEESARPFEEMRAIHGEIISSAESLIRDPNERADDTERDRWENAIGWVDDGEDILALRLAATIAAVDHVCRPLIADQHPPRPAVRAASLAPVRAQPVQGSAKPSDGGNMLPHSPITVSRR
ncbi:hypothetical protein ABIC65_000195 [Sphingomonas trueperi]|uniref:hypothetical protein n=1 Tax=Sphingomonas trueperi TaxID=53317 RepID=UPI003399FCBC